MKKGRRFVAPSRNYGLHNTPKYDILLPNMLGECDWLTGCSPPRKKDGFSNERIFCQDLPVLPPNLGKKGEQWRSEAV